MNWTSEQEEIFNWFENGYGNAMGIALPGCTKTSTCIEGLNRAKSDSALYAVFGKRNQVEAESKIKNNKAQVKTFHSIGFKFVMNNWRGVRGDGYTEFNRIKIIYPEAPKQVIFQTARLVSFLKNTFISPTLIDAVNTANERGIDGGQHDDYFPASKLAEMALESIKLSLEYPKDRKISFDDMIWLPVTQNWVRKSFDLIVCDESQDLNLPQMTMALGMVNDGGRIFAVGDSNQAIYGFRGAMANSMDIFKEKLNAIEFKLTTNFRCGKKIIEFAQKLMPELKAHSGAQEGIVETTFDEKAWKQIKVNDVILSRTNAPLMPVALNLIRKKIPAYVSGKDIGKNLINIIEDLNASNVNDFYDKLQRWLDNKVQKSVGWFASRAIALAQDQYETLKVLAESCNSVQEIISRINSLFQDADYVRVPSVILSSVHKFKGLEAENVNLISSSFKTRGSDPSEMAEEQNIYKVAITRAKNRLTLVATE